MQTRRRKAIGQYHILDSASEADFDNITMLTARICGAQSAAISFIDDHRQWFKATWGIDQRETPIAVSFCAHAIESEAIFVVRDAHLDPLFANNPLVTGAPHIRFYAGMRIEADDGTPIASLCVFDPQPRPGGLTEQQAVALRVLASQVQALLQLRLSLIDREAQVAAQTKLSNELRYVADHDVLTGLPHRGPFNKRLRSAIHDARQDGARLALMLIDVDHFKQINDSLGHTAGDAMLIKFAERLRGILRVTDTVARLGGDEFGVVLTDINRSEEVSAIVHSLIERLHKPMEHEGRLVDCRASIGLAIYPDHADTAELLTRCCDQALAEAKQSRGCVETFHPGMAEEFERESRMLKVARQGIEMQRIVPHYQPKIALSSGRLVGFEALVRCALNEGPAILPEMFELAFADRELAAAISRQMIDRVLDDMRSWIDRGLAFGHVAINTCAADFHANDFAERLLGNIEQRGLDPRLIEVEVTEGVFLGRGAHHVARALSVLSQRGIRIALDDFGTGFASLTHLKQFPVDVLKIDRSFVAGIGSNPDDTAIVRALIGLGQSLGIETVAEGIETLAQAEFVKTHGCDVGQGFLYSAAHPADLVPSIIDLLTDPEAA
ncbi:MAG: EAL domain-containing protein [Novosphingobium sp.]|uniref:sensor domain-containing phosphodiesterase n=1 Tax=Novosphingobium sp. TaxID=1874826 RepID=UPI002734DAA0|nr:EAL domain-containing protein [Novosphingobium sp.]MDP3551948.1 EAL domain-containing protein [Novosphingobium sp.]